MTDYIRDGFEIGHNICIKTGTENYYKIVHKDLLCYVHTHSAVAAGATQNYAEISELEPPHNQLYQIQKIYLVEGNVKLYVKQPAATNRFGTNKSPEGGYLTDEFDEMDVCLFLMENYPPNVQLVNGTLSSITARIRWLGWRYQLEKISRPANFQQIRIGGPSD